jgi:hypothetical protein
MSKEWDFNNKWFRLKFWFYRNILRKKYRIAYDLGVGDDYGVEVIVEQKKDGTQKIIHFHHF